MKRRVWRKHLALALSLCVTLSATVQSTFGFLTTRSQQIENTFQPQQPVEGDLILLKTIEHPFGEAYQVPETLSFDFKVDLGSHYALTTLETTEGTVITDENGSLLVSLQPDAPIGINGIDEGTEVTVTELAAMPKGFAPKDELTQTVTVSPEGNTTAEFVNVYTPAPVRPLITVGGTKTLVGREWQPDDRFTFLLEQQVGDDRVLLDVDTITEDTAFGFNAAIQSLSFDTAGEYVFYISELDGSLADMTYDAAVYDFTVTVADADMDGSLEIASVTGENAVITEDAATGSYDVAVNFTNTYTAPTPEDPGNVVYQIDDINGLPDTTVRVPVLAWYDEGTASISMQFAVPEGFIISGYEFGNAYTGEENALWSAEDYSFTWTSPDGTDQIAESGAAILYLLVDVPADAEIGETYPVIFTEDSVSVSDAEGNTPAFDTVDGSVFILEAPQPDPGHAVYQIDDVNGLAGTTVRVPVLAWFDDGAASLAMQFTVPEGFAISGYEPGNAYTGETVWSDEDYSFRWTSPDGAVQIAEAGSVILYLLVDIPADAAADTAYPIDFVEGSISVSDNSDEDVIFSTINGSVYVLDVPTVPAGNVVYNIGDTEATPGSKVDVPVDVWFDNGTASFSMTFDIPEGFTIDSIAYGDGYEDNGTFTFDPESGTLVWASNDGSNYVPTPGENIAAITLTVPEDAEIGTEYPIGITEIIPVDENGNPLEYTVNEGTVSIIAPETTTTPVETTTTETTTTFPNPGNVVYNIGDTEATPGSKVDVPVDVWFDNGTASFSMTFDIPEGFTIDSIAYGDGYEDNGTFTFDPESGTLVWTSNDGSNYVPTPGENIATITLTVPEDAEIGTEYPIGITEIIPVDENGNPLEYTVNEGTVSIIAPETTTTESTTTTTETTTTFPNPGNVVYNIGDTEATPGSKVDVPVDVWFDNGTASFSMTFDVPEGFTIDSITYGDGYEDNGTFTFDPESGTLVWTSNDGSNYVPTPGENIATITLTVPEDAEIGTEYPIGITEIIPVDENGNPLEYTVNEGTVSIIAPETTTTESTTTTTTFPNPGNVVYNIGDTEATPGSKVDVPVDVWFDNGTASFSMTFDIPEGFTIDSIAYGDGYEDNGTFTFDPENGTLVWTSNDGSNYVPTPGQNIAVLTIAVPEDAVAGDVYLISATDVVPQDAYGSLLTYVVNDGELTILAMETTTTPMPGYTTVTTYVTEFTPPTRVNYWSHDLRTFVESGGLDGLSALIHLYKYNVNADGCFVNADGTVVTDAEGNPMVYDAESPVFPEISYAFEYKWLDVTATTQPPADADSPVEVYEPGVHAYPIAVYYDQSKQTDPDFIFGDGSPMFFGEFDIFIGLKGDVTLDDAVDTRDAIEVLRYYNSVTIMGTSYEFHDDPYLHDLGFYLGDVYYTQQLDTVTAIAILQYYNSFTVIGEPVTWTDICGYDFPDEFFEGTEESVPEEEPAAEETESSDETDPAEEETTPVEEEAPVTEAVSSVEQPADTDADLMAEIQARLAGIMTAQP
ncbi:MAG: hypothetical protein E7503_03320 [Ruminococcus sp.]|nr:hypothetical protein [Ruminococcus sp.]